MWILPARRAQIANSQNILNPMGPTTTCAIPLSKRMKEFLNELAR